MFMKVKNTGDLVKIEHFDQLCSPLSDAVVGRRQAGEEEQEREDFSKNDLTFPSDEELPRCWKDPSYQLDGDVA